MALRKFGAFVSIKNLKLCAGFARTSKYSQPVVDMKMTMEGKHYDIDYDDWKVGKIVIPAHDREEILVDINFVEENASYPYIQNEERHIGDVFHHIVDEVVYKGKKKGQMEKVAYVTMSLYLPKSTFPMLAAIKDTAIYIVTDNIFVYDHETVDKFRASIRTIDFCASIAINK
jgi:hypothetical protein